MQIPLTLLNLLVSLAMSGETAGLNPVSAATSPPEMPSKNLIAATDLNTASIIQTAISATVSLLACLIYLPLQLTSATLMYFDLRVRTEGFDLALLAESASDEQGDVADVIAQTPVLETTGMITWEEAGYFALLSLGAVLLFGALFGVGLGVGLLATGTAGGAPGF